MKKILYIQPIHESGMKKLAEKYEVVVAPDLSRETLKKYIADAEAVVSRLTVIDRELMSAAPGLKAVCKHGVGVDNIDVGEATRRNIAVLTTGDANSLSVAEHAFFAMGSLIKMINPLDREVRAGNWAFRDRAKAYEMTGRTLGIIGLGKIGSRLAKMARCGFDMEVLVYDPCLSAETIAEKGCLKVDDLNDLCARVDILSIHAPLTENTRGMLTEEHLAKMRPSALLINFARGGIIKEEVLYWALSQKVIAGAAIDVFELEPPAEDNLLLSLDNVILSPHCASFTEESRSRMSMLLAEGIEDVLEGRTPRFAVNR